MSGFVSLKKLLNAIWPLVSRYDLPYLLYLEGKVCQLKAGSGMLIQLEHEVCALPHFLKERQNGYGIIIFIA